MSDPFDRTLEESLGALGAPAGQAPPIPEDLERQLAALAAVKTRVPRRELAGVIGLSLVYASGVVALSGLRRDLWAMPRWHLFGFAALWLASFASITWLVMVPARGQVMPRARLAAVVAGIAAALLIGGGLLLPRAAPGLSTVYAPTVLAVVEHAGCIQWGLLGAALPILLAALAVRGSIPVGSRLAAAAIGASGGALGGLVLQLHCPITERFHVGLVHGGLVVMAGAVAALAARIAGHSKRSAAGVTQGR